MKNRWLLNIGLALLVGALILLVLYRPGTGKEAQGTPLPAIPVDAVQRIKLVRPKQPEIVLERIGEHWRLHAPRKARASSFRVNELLSLAAMRVSTRFPAPRPDEKQAKAAGLQIPGLQPETERARRVGSHTGAEGARQRSSEPVCGGVAACARPVRGTVQRQTGEGTRGPHPFRRPPAHAAASDRPAHRRRDRAATAAALAGAGSTGQGPARPDHPRGRTARQIYSYPHRRRHRAAASRHVRQPARAALPHTAAEGRPRRPHPRPPPR